MRSVLFTTLCLVLVLGCGGESAPTGTATTPESVETPEVPPTPEPPTPEPPKAEFEAPAGNLRGDAKLGKVVYGQFCAVCHGAGGKGDGPTSASLNPKPADHTDHVYMSALSDQRLFQVISKGGASVGKSPLMAPWGGVLTEDQIKDVIAFVRQLSSS